MDPIDLDLSGQRIRALSVGGVENCYQLSAFDACLDIGRCPPGSSNAQTLLLTMPISITPRVCPITFRCLKHGPQLLPRIWCPAASLPALSRILEAWGELQADTERLR